MPGWLGRPGWESGMAATMPTMEEWGGALSAELERMFPTRLCKDRRHALMDCRGIRRLNGKFSRSEADGRTHCVQGYGGQALLSLSPIGHDGQ